MFVLHLEAFSAFSTSPAVPVQYSHSTDGQPASTTPPPPNPRSPSKIKARSRHRVPGIPFPSPVFDPETAVFLHACTINCTFYLGVPFVLAILVRSIIPSGCRQTQPGCPTIGVHCVPACARTSHAAQLRKSSDVKTAIFGLLSFTVQARTARLFFPARGARGVASFPVSYRSSLAVQITRRRPGEKYQKSPHYSYCKRRYI